MSEADLQEASRRVRRLQELIEDQRQRVAFFEARSDARSLQRAQSLLLVFEQCLKSARYMLIAQRRSHGLEE